MPNVPPLPRFDPPRFTTWTGAADGLAVVVEHFTVRRLHSKGRTEKTSFPGYAG